MSTCVLNPSMMRAIPRQTYQEYGAKFMSDSSYWSPIPIQVSTLQQPPSLSLVPDSRLQLNTFSSGDIGGEIQPSWSPFPDQADFETANSLAITKPITGPQYDSHQSSDHQGGYQPGFDTQIPTSNSYHAEYSDLGGLQQTQPAVSNISFKQETPDNHELLHQRNALPIDRPKQPDVRPGYQRTGKSLPANFEKLQMTAFAQKQTREEMKNRIKKRSLDGENPTSAPKRDSSGDSNQNFCITAGGIPSGAAGNFPTLHSQQPAPQQQQQLPLFSRGFLPTVTQLQDIDTSNRGSQSLSSFSMDTTLNVEDTEALVMNQFQAKVFQLNMGTRVGFQESLFRLARSAREQQHSTRIPAEEDLASNMMDVGSDSYRPTSRPQSRVRISAHTIPADHELVSMLYFPLRPPGLQCPADHPPWSRARAEAAAPSSPANWDWLTPVNSEKDSTTMVHKAQIRGRDGSAVTREEMTRTVSPYMAWTGAPHLTDYASSSPGSSPVDRTMVRTVQADHCNLACRSPVAHSARQLGGLHWSTSKPAEIQAPRRCDSEPSLASDPSNSFSHGGRSFSYNDLGYQGRSSYSLQERGHVYPASREAELRAMNMNEDILGAALSIRNRAEGNQIGGFQRQASSASVNPNVAVGFPPLLYDDGSNLEAQFLGRSLGYNNHNDM